MSATSDCWKRVLKFCAVCTSQQSVFAVLLVKVWEGEYFPLSGVALGWSLVNSSLIRCLEAARVHHIRFFVQGVYRHVDILVIRQCRKQHFRFNFGRAKICSGQSRFDGKKIPKQIFEKCLWSIASPFADLKSDYGRFSKFCFRSDQGIQENSRSANSRSDY